MREWEYKVLDHKYNNLKRWFQAMANHPDGLNSLVVLGKIIGKGGMFDYLENVEKELDDVIINALLKDSPNAPTQ